MGQRSNPMGHKLPDTKTRHLFLRIGSHNNINKYFKLLQTAADSYGGTYMDAYNEDLSYYGHLSNNTSTQTQGQSGGGIFSSLRNWLFGPPKTDEVTYFHCDSYIQNRGCVNKSNELVKILQNLQAASNTGNDTKEAWQKEINEFISYLLCCRYYYKDKSFELDNVYMQILVKILSVKYYCKYAFDRYNELMVSQKILQSSQELLNVGRLLRDKMNDYYPDMLYSFDDEKAVLVVENKVPVEKPTVAVSGSTPVSVKPAAPVPGSGTAATVPGSGTAATVPGSGTAATVPGSGTAATVPGSGTAAPVPGSGTAATVPGLGSTK